VFPAEQKQVTPLSHIGQSLRGLKKFEEFFTSICQITGPIILGILLRLIRWKFNSKFESTLSDQR